MVRSDDMADSWSAGETVRWSAYPSWRQFTWLYFLSLMAGLRGWLFLRFEVAGGEMWAGCIASIGYCGRFYSCATCDRAAFGPTP